MQTASRASLSGATSRSPRPRGLLGFLSVVVVTVYALDQLTKVLAVQRLSNGAEIDLVGQYLRLQLTRNSGAAGSLAANQTGLLTVIAVVVVIAVLRVLSRVRNFGWALGLGLVLAGALGNLTDRLVRAPGFGRGKVVDFIAYGNLFIGNVADIAIVLAAVGLFWLTVRGTSPGDQR